MTATVDYLQAILRANVYDVADETPLDEAPRLSARVGRTVLLKREDTQPIFSFKLRGAYNKMSSLPPDVLAKGVVTASAGNHAQGVALSARRLGVSATVVMPETTPSIKVQSVEALGGSVVLAGDTFDVAYTRAQEITAELGGTFIHPYDDPHVIAGQGTIGMEILRQCREPIEAIFVPVGGGGLIAGIAAYVKELQPATRVIGVEPIDADAMARSLEAGERVILPYVGLFADGVAVKQVGAEPFRIARTHVDEMILVSTDEICAAIKDIFEDTRTIVEPAAALSVAGLKKYAEKTTSDGVLVSIVSGANSDFDRLRFVAERAEIGEHREAVFAATIPEQPGSFKAFCSVIGRRSITEFNYRFSDPNEAHVFAGVAVRHTGELAELFQELEARNITALDLTGNETAKLHVRHLVGGRAQADDELLYRFEFPERPGALMRFLEAMTGGWNISLFHYRNHGADVGRVLCGLQVPSGEMEQFHAFLEQLGYPFWDESQNPAYKLFLR